MEGTIWALVPPILAIALALLTKEVYFSLLAGICVGALLYTDFAVGAAMETTVNIMSGKVADNISIIIFLVLLGMLVALMSKSGASKAYGEWAVKNIRTKRGALFATAGLGALIFVDDYFNCLTVGTIMNPITDKQKISRAKLAYIIDATAAPVCIIAPVSSWAAAVSSSLPEGTGLDGFMLFLKAIPYNYYAIFTLLMVFLIIIWDFDFSKMKKYEAAYGTKVTGEKEAKAETTEVSGNGKVRDLIIPIVLLIVFCIAAMLYTGGILEGASIKDAFADCSSAYSLVIGSFFTMIATALLYLPRKVITFKQFTDSLTEGFKAMVPAILILTFAWTLSGVCGEEYLNIGSYVSGVVSEGNIPLAVIPIIFFAVALGLAFATGTSWGTFSILLPIVCTIFANDPTTLMVLSMSAVMAGAVCGDHISPISDTTILSSTGAGCDHIEHVNTQIPYALLIAIICCVSYLIAGFAGNGYLGLGIGIVLTVLVLWIIKVKTAKEGEKSAA
ncbi:MAG: Na+/H+ antiporter NhaC family protein [Lachnospiraceae bacterium]|nr:Na+/H+ antiporter NhaC family protein [Lachnospiraceae bacterium]